MIGHELHVVLRDGTRALLRPIRPDDKERLVRGLELLSPRSRYLRFHTPLDHFTDGQLRYLTEVDQVHHVAWIALDEDRPELPGMGVARYVRVADEPTVAEVAVTVIDEYQGRGLGTVLLGVLGRTARDHGLDTFRTYVLPENELVSRLLDDLQVTSATTDDGVRLVDVPVVADVDALPDTPAGRVLKAAAAGRLRTLLSTIVPVRITEDLSPPDGTGGPGSSPDLEAWLGATEQRTRGNADTPP